MSLSSSELANFRPSDAHSGSVPMHRGLGQLLPLQSSLGARCSESSFCWGTVSLCQAPCAFKELLGCPPRHLKSRCFREGYGGHLNVSSTWGSGGVKGGSRPAQNLRPAFLSFLRSRNRQFCSVTRCSHDLRARCRTMGRTL